MEKQDINRTLTSLRNLCSKREYCISDIREKAVKALDGDVNAASDVLSALICDGYLDNRRYATAFARDKSSLGGWGRVKIRFNLQSKGISGADIDYAIAQIDEDKAEEKLDRLIRTKIKALEGDPEWKIKMIRFVLGRGYEYDDVSSALERIQNAE